MDGARVTAPTSWKTRGEPWKGSCRQFLPDVDTRVQVSTGSAARTILQHAADVDADLVVVGRSRGFKMLGSTALRVFRKNDRALLVIPQRGPSHRSRRTATRRLTEAAHKRISEESCSIGNSSS